MSETRSAKKSSSLTIVAVAAAIVGAVVLALGLVLVPESALGGAWVGAIGLSLLLAGAVTTDRVGDALGLSSGTRHRLALAFACLAAFLLVTFVIVNFASFEPTVIEESG